MSFTDRDPDETPEPWQQQDEPPSTPLPAKKAPLAGLFQGTTHVPPSCPVCGSADVVERKRDSGTWCRSCNRAYFRASPSSLLFGTGLWFL